jgi:hypothetical protein
VILQETALPTTTSSITRQVPGTVTISVTDGTGFTYNFDAGNTISTYEITNMNVHFSAHTIPRNGSLTIELEVDLTPEGEGIWNISLGDGGLGGTFLPDFITQVGQATNVSGTPRTASVTYTPPVGYTGIVTLTVDAADQAATGGSLLWTYIDPEANSIEVVLPTGRKKAAAFLAFF